MKKTIPAALLSAFLLFSGSMTAQSGTAKPFVLGLTEQIKSVVLAENRTLNIYLPQGYNKDSAKTYPVIYLLDGSPDEDFIHISGLVQFLTMIETLPPSIVVGVGNVDRKRDFTYPTTIEQDKKDFPTTGGSEKFISYLEKEVLPFIEKKYKAGNRKTIIGQSLGGLLATELLLKKPGLFSDYIIVSPSLWWDNESLLNAAPALLEKNFSQPANVYISVGTEGKQMEEDAKKLSDILKESKGNVTVFFAPLPEEDHLTILHNSVYKAFGLLNPKKTK